jgi:hypothetical protein
VLSGRISDGAGVFDGGLPDDLDGEVLAVPGGPSVGVRVPGGRQGKDELSRWDEHREEVDLCLEMWERVARGWGNETLLRLARQAQAEARVEKALERQAIRRCIGAYGDGEPGASGAASRQPWQSRLRTDRAE